MDRDTPKREVKAEMLIPSANTPHGAAYDPEPPRSRLSTDSPAFPSQPKSSHSRSNSPLNIKEETIGAEIEVKMTPGHAPKLSRKRSQKIIARPAVLYLDEEDKYAEATSSFSVIEDCIYANKHMGETEPALECDCSEEWDPVTGKNKSCGEDSDCINRATKMECIEDCSCGSICQNMRFQQKIFSKVTVFKTEKKGYGLRADTNLKPNDFIFEYIGEVINEPSFRKRTRQYDTEGIKHFYFMSLSKGEFVDATKKGNLGRFCNHSCNPNCYVDKWVVGDKLRMGIFAERAIKAGEELVFNYNVDRYGADPQPCYCGEPNCTGFIGGKTQTERGTKLSNATIEALGIEDFDDWDTAVAKKPRKARKTGEDDEEYISEIQSKSLEEDGVTKVMAALMQCKEKWIAVKLLGRVQRVSDERVIGRVVRMHGYRIFKSALLNFNEDANVCLQVLDILFKLPRITKNKIQDSGIEETVSKLKDSEDQRVAQQATEILEIWSKLEVAYRIPRMKRDPNATLPVRIDRFDRRERERSKSPKRSKSPVAPTGPKNSTPQRNPNFFSGPRPPRPRQPAGPLPPGWFQAFANGRVYFYSANGQTTWTRPTEPAAPPVPRQPTHEERLQEIINSITKSSNTPQGVSPATATPKDVSNETPEPQKEEKWMSFSEEKQKKIYENTLFPHVKHVIDKYKNKLPREEIKRFGKEVSKKLVNSDYKNGRVKNPNKISSKQVHSVKKFVKEYFDKAVVKHRALEKAKREKAAAKQRASGSRSRTPPGSPSPFALSIVGRSKEEDEEVQLTDDEVSDNEDNDTPNDGDKKRKRIHRNTNGGASAEDEASSKKIKVDEVAPPPPPPPPPPPADGFENVDGTEPIESPEQDEAMTGLESHGAKVNGTSEAKPDAAPGPSKPRDPRLARLEQ